MERSERGEPHLSPIIVASIESPAVWWGPWPRSKRARARSRKKMMFVEAWRKGEIKHVEAMEATERKDHES